MSLLPLSPFLVAALVCVAATAPSGPAPGAAATPALHRVSADTQWRQYLLVGPGPVFRHVDQPMRG